MYRWAQTSDDYRVTQVGDQWQPEMLYHIKDVGEQWVPLKADGYWADPECYSTGKVTKLSLMSEEAARRAIWNAQLVNRAA